MPKGTWTLTFDPVPFFLFGFLSFYFLEARVVLLSQRFLILNCLNTALNKTFLFGFDFFLYFL